MTTTRYRVNLGQLLMSECLPLSVSCCLQMQSRSPVASVIGVSTLENSRPNKEKKVAPLSPQTLNPGSHATNSYYIRSPSSTPEDHHDALSGALGLHQTLVVGPRGSRAGKWDSGGCSSPTTAMSLENAVSGTGTAAVSLMMHRTSAEELELAALPDDAGKDVKWEERSRPPAAGRYQVGESTRQSGRVCRC